MVKAASLAVVGLAAALFAGVQPASADTVDIFTVAGTFTDNSKVTGTVTVDVTTGVVMAESLSYLGKTYATLLDQFAFFGNTNAGKTPKAVDFEFDAGTSSSQQPRIDLAVVGTTAIDSLIGFAGGALCSISDSCGPDQSGGYWVSAYHPKNGSTVSLETGSLTLKSSRNTGVPEPSTGALAGVALLGLAGLSLMKRLN